MLAAIIEYHDQILLARNAAWTHKMYALITGFMEAGETPQEGIAREIKEETNLDASELNLIGVYDFQRMNQVIIAYHAVADGEVKLSPELVDYQLYDLRRGEVLAGGHRAMRWPTGCAAAGTSRSSSSGRGRAPGSSQLQGTAMNIDKEIDTRGLNCPLAHPEGQEGADRHAERPAAEGGVHRRRARCATSRPSPSRPATNWSSSRPSATEFIHVLRRR